MPKKKEGVYYYIYITTCLVNLKIYVGKRTCQWHPDKDGTYLGSGVIINKAVKKHGRDNFKKEIIEKCSKEELNEKEICWISFHNARDRQIGYNITTGGEQDGTSIKDHYNKADILKRRSTTWKENYYSNPEWQTKRKAQLDEIRKLRKNFISPKRIPIANVNKKTGEVIEIFNCIEEAESKLKITGIGSAIRRRGLCHDMYFQVYIEGVENYGEYIPSKKDYSYRKGVHFSVATEFKKGIIPWSKGKKGIHLSPSSEFKKGQEPWNKGIKYEKITGRNHFNSKQLVTLNKDYSLHKTYTSIREARKESFHARGINKAIALFSEYRGLFWMYEKDYLNSQIESIEYIEEIPESVYNIEVEDNHNYFVNGILVKNCDDPISPKKAASEVERQNAIDFYNHTLYSRLNQPDIGVRIVIMQRLHENDLSANLMDKKHGRPEDHEHICIPGELMGEVEVKPAELTKHYTNGLFWPTRFSRLILDQYKKALGSLQYAGQILQRPVPPEGNLFKKAWFGIIAPELVQRNNSESPIHFFIDTAYTEDETERNDPSGILACFKKDNMLYIVNFVEVWMEFPKLIAFIKEYVLVNGYTSYSAIYVEPKASGKSVVQQLKAGTELNVMEIDGDFIKDDKVTRATAVSPIVQSGKVTLVEGAWNNHFLSQLTSFPKASHDEAVDTTVYALNYLMSKNDFLAFFMDN